MTASGVDLSNRFQVGLPGSSRHSWRARARSLFLRVLPRSSQAGRCFGNGQRSITDLLVLIPAPLPAPGRVGVRLRPAFPP